MITLTRLYRFAASHRLHVDSLSAAANLELFGKCNNPFGHGHDYILAVTVAGEPEPGTGLIVPLSHLDRLVQDRVLKLFDHRNLNVDVPRLRGTVPTTENVVAVIANILLEQWQAYLRDAPHARLVQVRLRETERNSFEIDLRVCSRKSTSSFSRHESVPVNA